MRTRESYPKPLGEIVHELPTMRENEKTPDQQRILQDKFDDVQDTWRKVIETNRSHDKYAEMSRKSCWNSLDLRTTWN